MTRFSISKYFSAAPVIFLFSSVSALANTQEAALKLAMGAMTAFFIGAIVIFYKMGEFICKKVSPNSPKWIKKMSGVAFVFIAFSIWGSVTGK